MTAPKIDRLETSPYVPVIGPTRWALLRWQWFGRFLGRPRPVPKFYVYVVSGVAYANPRIYEMGAKVLIVKDYTPTPENDAMTQDCIDRLREEFPCR